MISGNGGLPALRYTPQVTQRWPQGSEPASVHSSPNYPLAGTLLLFWSVHKQVHLFSLFVRVVFLCVVHFSPTSPNSGAKIVGGFLRSEKSIFPFFHLFSASFSCFFSFYFLFIFNFFIHVDYTEMPKFRGYDFALVVTCGLTRFTRVFPCLNTSLARRPSRYSWKSPSVSMGHPKRLTQTRTSEYTQTLAGTRES